MAALGEALGLPSSYFDTFISQPVSVLRALYYPPTGAHAQDGKHRADAHTDYRSLTVFCCRKLAVPDYKFRGRACGLMLRHPRVILWSTLVN